MKKSRLILLLLIILGFVSCGNADPQEWPAETDCNYYEVDPVGNCRKAIEMCTFGQEHCMATLLLCPGQIQWDYKSNGCVKP